MLLKELNSLITESFWATTDNYEDGTSKKNGEDFFNVPGQAGCSHEVLVELNDLLTKTKGAVTDEVVEFGKKKMQRSSLFSWLLWVKVNDRKVYKSPEGKWYFTY